MAALSQNTMTSEDIALALAAQKKAALATPKPTTSALPAGFTPMGPSTVYATPTPKPVATVAVAPRPATTAPVVAKPAAAPVAAPKPAPVAAPLVSEEEKTRLYALEASMQAPKPAEVEAALPPVESTVVAETKAAQDGVIASMTKLLTDQAAMRAQLAAAVKKVASPENYQEMLDAALKTMMPQFEARKKELAETYQELGRKMDINQEQRGVYSSRFGADQYRQQQEQQAQDVASQLANTQAGAAGEARQTIAQQLQALGMQGDWQTADAGLNMDALNTQASMSTAMGNLGLDAQGQRIQQQQFGQEFNQKNDQFNRTYTLEEAKVAQDQKQFDASMTFNETELAQRSDQWAQEFAQKGEFHQDELDQFAKSMGLQWAQLGASQAAQLSDAAYRAASLALDEKQFDSSLDQQRAFDLKDDLEYEANVLNQLYTGYVGDTSGDDATKKRNMLTYASLYKSDPALYSKMTDVIGATFPATSTTAPVAKKPTFDAANLTSSGMTSQAPGPFAPATTKPKVLPALNWGYGSGITLGR